MKFFLALVFVLASTTNSSADYGNAKESDLSTEAEIEQTNSEIKTRDNPIDATSHPCPYTCNDAGFSRGGCREWKVGDICFVGPKGEEDKK